MRIYWTLNGIPELAALPRAERGRAWRRAYGKLFRHWQTWVGLIICGGFAGMGAYAGIELRSPFIGAAVGGGIGGFVFGQVAIHVARRYYPHLLAGH